MSASNRHAGHAALRRGRISLPGHCYLVTFATFRRAPHFAAAPIALVAARAITDMRLWAGPRLLAWVLMPDHWHGLVELGRDDRLPSVVQRLKANTARQVRGECPSMGRVWAAGFHDRGIRDEAGLAAAARYLVLNPVRAGLVRRAGDYPFWDAVWV